MFLNKFERKNQLTKKSKEPRAKEVRWDLSLSQITFVDFACCQNLLKRGKGEVMLWLCD